MALDRCPPDPEDSAERYCLDRMLPDEARAFDRHCVTCADCAAMLARERKIVALMRAAGRALGVKAPKT